MKKLKINPNIVSQPTVESKQTTVNNFKRLLAYVIDWYVASMLAGIPIVLTYSIFFKNLTITQELSQLPVPYCYIVGVIAILVYLAYFIVIPMKMYRGQTFGKRIMDIKIVKDDGSNVDWMTLFKREVIGVMLVEGYIAASSSFLHQMICLFVGHDLNQFFVYGYGIITVLSIVCACASPKRKMFHDMIAKTQLVIYKESV